MSRGRVVVAGAALAAGVAFSLFGVGFGSGGDPPAVRDRASGAAVGEIALRELLTGFSTGDTAGFVRELEARVEADPYDADALTLLGLAYQQRARETGDPGFLSLSERALRAALDVRLDQPLAVTGLATLAVARHRFQNALGYARQALRRDPKDAAALGALGDALANLGSYEQAFDAYDRMAELAPGAAAYGRVAHARYLLGRPEDALEALEYAFEVGPQLAEHRAWALVQRGNLLLDAGRTAEAGRAYRRALAELPGYVHAEAGLARVAAAEGRFGEAAGLLGPAVERLPSPQYAILLGDIHTAAGNQAQAAAAYGLVEAIETLLVANGVRTELQTALFDLDHDRDVAAALARARAAYQAAPSVSAADTVAWGLYKNGRCEEARAYSVEALRLGTLDALMLFHRGMIEACLGNEGEGRRFLLRALERNPHFSLVHAPAARAMLEELSA